MDAVTTGDRRLKERFSDGLFICRILSGYASRACSEKASPVYSHVCGGNIQVFPSSVICFAKCYDLRADRLISGLGRCVNSGFGPEIF